MNSHDLATGLPRFFEEVASANGGLDRPLTVADLRRGIYEARLQEISDWSSRCLDMFDAHAARFADDSPSASVLEAALAADPEAGLDELASFGTPSPFAWT